MQEGMKIRSGLFFREGSIIARIGLSDPVTIDLKDMWASFGAYKLYHSCKADDATFFAVEAGLLSYHLLNNKIAALRLSGDPKIEIGQSGDNRVETIDMELLLETDNDIIEGNLAKRVDCRYALLSNMRQGNAPIATISISYNDTSSSISSSTGLVIPTPYIEEAIPIFAHHERLFRPRGLKGMCEDLAKL